MRTPVPPTLRWLIASVSLYMALALIAGVIAIVEKLPAEFGGSSTGFAVTQDFMYGMGTALSPPFYTLILQLAFLLLVPREDRWGLAGIIGLSLIGLMTCMGAVGEPINRQIFNPVTFDLLKAVMMAGQIFLSLAIIVLGLLEWRRRRREL